MADYCSVCGRKTPPRRRGEEYQRSLHRKGWLAHRTRPLRDGLPGAEYHFMCPDCLKDPSPFAKELLDLWNKKR
jgi:hypothetical protein